VRRAASAIVVLLLAGLRAVAPAAAQRSPAYSARQDGDVVRLEDAERRMAVSIMPSVGNIAFELTVHDQNVLHWPFASVAEFKARPGMSGIPFLAPWANRLDEQAFYANGRKYAFDMSMGNVRGAIPIHGFVTTTDQWRVVDARADRTAAWVTSRLEFARQPAWMKQWPFAHTIEMTYRLGDGALEVATSIVNASAEPMPIAVGFHPYFRLTDSPRDDWTIALAARTHWLLAPTKVPTGETEPIDRILPGAAPALRDRDLDDVFADLVRDAQGRATMTIAGRSQRLDVVIGSTYKAVVVWAPKQAAFVCIEPMAGITNALNLAQRGAYGELQSVAPGGTWQASFWVRPHGF
jgi:aldose 1-epimerase